ncbi:YebG family protein [Aestuariibacter sp. AA17]|uniref:YebG family protein n=1 Tax=Fluctibacter corallii TaxID=2984329 RepID=A0ABT3ABJ7_9ALTE|nr:YebG family protein [Aestuariibacter sp. AA17]MCV2885977.1 YebG family protein [Aestuariibacter sp. AA17]
MAIIIKYVVEHKGVEKLVTTDKKEADKYDKMLDVADNLAEYISAKGIKLETDILEELSIVLSKNKDALGKILKGSAAEKVLEEDKAEVVSLDKVAE